MGNRQAFLDMIAFSELGKGLLDISDNGYNVIVGSTVQRPILFMSYADHPRKLINIRTGLSSTAAGRYQLLARYFDAYKKLLNLPDFSPPSQDAIALQQIRERGALPLIDSGDLEGAIKRVSNIWASFPSAGYGQHEHSFDTLKAAYLLHGGTINE